MVFFKTFSALLAKGPSVPRKRYSSGRRPKKTPNMFLITKTQEIFLLSKEKKKKGREKERKKERERNVDFPPRHFLSSPN